MSPRKKKDPGPDQHPGGSDQTEGSVSELDTETQNTRSTEADTQAAQDVIRINTDVDPELNPNDPRFNVKKYREYLSKLDLSDVKARLNNAVKAVADVSAAATDELNKTGAIQAALPDMIIGNLQEIIHISQWATETAQTAQQALIPLLKSLFDKDTADKLAEFIEGLRGAEARIAALEPFLEKELPAIRKAPGFEDVTLEYMLGCVSMDGETIAADTPDGKPIPAAIRAALERAIDAAKNFTPEIITALRTDIVEYPLDKLDANIWDMLKEPTGRQLKMFINTAKAGSEDKIGIFYSIDFSELENSGIKVTKQLTTFDKFVYMAISALYNAGNRVISSRQIYFAMGGTKEPSKKQTDRIRDSVFKMRKADIQIDTIKEAEIYNYDRFQHRGYLLPAEITTAEINGQIVKDAIKPLMEPPIMTFAKKRKQITTLSVKMLQAPVNMTDANLLIADYLLERIGRAKRSGQSCKILYDTLYEKAQIKTRSQKTRAPEKIKTYLDHYKACGEIADYQILKDGIKIDFPPAPKE